MRDVSLISEIVNGRCMAKYSHYCALKSPLNLTQKKRKKKMFLSFFPWKASPQPLLKLLHFLAPNVVDRSTKKPGESPCKIGGGEETIF